MDSQAQEHKGPALRNLCGNTQCAVSFINRVGKELSQKQMGNEAFRKN